MKQPFWVVGAALLLPCIEALAQAQAVAYPARPVRVIVPTAPGGGVDPFARMISQSLSEQLKQPFIVDTRPGATGIIGTEIVAKAAPDGHTLLFAWTAPLAINPGLYAKLPYDVLRDFAPIIMPATTPNVIVVQPSSPVRTVKDLIDAARRAPGKVSFASSGVGGSSHLAAELFATMTGTAMTHIPYKATSTAVVDLIAGRVDVMFAAMAPALPHVRGGRLRAIAVTTSSRSLILPDLPTAADAVPGYAADTWYGMLAPAGTSPAIVGRLNQAVNAYLKEPGTGPLLHQQGFEAVGGTAESFAAFLRTELAKWGKLIKQANIRPE